MGDLDDLDAEQRQWRRHRFQAWSRLRAAEVARAKRVLDDPGATHEQKREAKILIGAYWPDAALLAASGGPGGGYGGGTGFGPAKRRARVPRPPSSRLRFLRALRAVSLRRRSASLSGDPRTLPAPPPVGADSSAGRGTASPKAIVVEASSTAKQPAAIRNADAAPDVAEEILGWKVLALGMGRRLRHDFDHPPLIVPPSFWSPTRDIEWPIADWLRATCSRDPEHEPPVEDCTCGIYAVNDPAGAEPYIWHAPLTVLVRVGLAGKVIPGSQGWRAERARIVALTRTGAGPRDFPRMLAHVAENYDVPILDLDLLRRPAGDQSAS